MYRYVNSSRVSVCAIAIMVTVAVSCVVAGCGVEERAEPELAAVSTMTEGARLAMQRYALAVPPSMREQSETLAVMGSKPMVESSLDAVRMVVKTATLECEVIDCDSAATEIERLVTRRRGYIVSSTVRNRDGDQHSGMVVLRVPVQDFEATLTEVNSLALKVESEDVRGDDVTEEFFDLSARLANKRKAEQRFLQILKAAKTAPEILDIERALMGLREEIERLEGRKRYIENQTDLSTINVAMHEPAPVVATRGESFWGKMAQGLGLGAERGLNTMVHVASACVALVVAGIPIVLGVVLMLWVLVRTYRKLKPRATESDATRV